MGRKFQYYCDKCSKEFGKREHIHLKSLGINLAFPVDDKWALKKLINSNGSELHFCNTNCLFEYILVNAAVGELR